MMSRHSTSRKQRAKVVWVKRAVQTFFVLAFSLWVFNQFKLNLVDRNARKMDDPTPVELTNLQKVTPHDPLMLTRKGLLRVVNDKEVTGGNDIDEVNERREESIDKEEEIEEWMKRLDMKRSDLFQFDEDVETANNTSDGVGRAEDDAWESASVNGSENFESLDSSGLEADQY